MTRKLETTFNLPPRDIDDETDESLSIDEAELVSQSTEILNALATTEKIDHALATVNDLSVHDDEMDDVAEKALQSYKDLCDLGLNVHDTNAGRIYEVAATMLKTALDAKDAKVSRKLKTIELQLKKAKLDQDLMLKNGSTDPSGSGEGAEFDRNELLSYMKNNLQEKGGKNE